jgi:hypothetical protein
MTEIPARIPNGFIEEPRRPMKRVPVMFEHAGLDCSDERLAQFTLWVSIYHPEFELLYTFDEEMRFDLVLTDDFVEAARAYAVAHSLSGIVPDHQWLGTFEDRVGRYFAYLRRQTADICTNGHLWDLQTNELPASEIVKAFKAWLEGELFEEPDGAEANGNGHTWQALRSLARRIKAADELDRDWLRFDVETAILTMQFADVTHLDDTTESMLCFLNADRCLAPINPEMARILLNATTTHPIMWTPLQTLVPDIGGAYIFSGLAGFSIMGAADHRFERRNRLVLTKMLEDKRHFCIEDVGRPGLLHICDDPTEAAMAFLASKKEYFEFLPVQWLGKFVDKDGVFWAYSKPVPNRKPSVHLKKFGDSTALAALFEQLEKDMSSSFADIRLVRLLTELREAIDSQTNLPAIDWDRFHESWIVETDASITGLPLIDITKALKPLSTSVVQGLLTEIDKRPSPFVADADQLELI